MALDQAFFDGISLVVHKNKYYNAERVDALLEDIRRQALKMNSDNEILRRQLFSLVGQKTEIGETLLSAKAIAQQIIQDAEDQAAKTLAEAEAQSREIVAGAEERQQKLQKTVDTAEKKLRKRMAACLDEIGDDLHALFEATEKAPEAPPADMADKVDAIAREVYAMENE